MTPPERAQRVRALMDEQGWSRARLAAHLGMHPEFVHALTRPEPIAISPWAAQALEQATGIPAADWRRETVGEG